MNATCCPDHASLEAYLLGQLDDEAIDAHLEECSGCRAALDKLDAAVNQPFACLREPAPAVTDWQQPTYQHLVSQANLCSIACGSACVLSAATRGWKKRFRAIRKLSKKSCLATMLSYAAFPGIILVAVVRA
jgi:hypothetical protein